MPQQARALTLNVVADAPDLRDGYYEPVLRPLKEVWHPPGNLYILDQGEEGACTGYGLAATVNLLYRFQGKSHRVSPHMLYEMARRYDEWPGEDYEGSSCRGAIKGWRNSGVCLEQLAPARRDGGGFVITPEISADARSRTLGAYYRLRPEITDFHAAINETGVIFASAEVHSGWYQTDEDSDGESVIPMSGKIVGGHAFAIVGYNSKGFWIQNSWGEENWGKGGLAIWRYEDWARNIMDAWVVQLALPTPQIFAAGAGVGRRSQANRGATVGTTPRQQIEHHFVHLDDGSYHDRGRYWSNPEHMAVVQHQLRTSGCEHLLLYAHGGLNSSRDSARRIAAMKDVFLANGIYPFHFMYDTGLAEELKDVILGKHDTAAMLTGGVGDWFDRRIENLTRKPGRALWREMKLGASKPFATKAADGTDVLERLLATVAMCPAMKIHVLGHSTGAILHAHLLARAASQLPDLCVSTCSLLAPAATNGLFETHFAALLRDGTIPDMTVYNLADKLEQGDTVAGMYGKSLLYLVSRAFEENPVASLLGMERYNAALDVAGLPVEFVYSRGGKSGRSTSVSHGGFDNDPATLNDVLRRVLGRLPKRRFTRADLDYG